jgi:nicotinate-nucleotide adenylyltransferase
LTRLGIFGGAFNPIHTAHLIIAEDVREQMYLDKVLFIPYANPPHKDPDALLDAGTRLELINAAIKDNVHFESSDIEIVNGRTSRTYTVDTLMHLHEMYKDKQTKFYLIIGIDNLIELHTWKEPGKLFRLSEVLVLNRPGFLIQDVKNEFYNQVTFIPAPDINISSSDIRHRIKEKRSIKYLVPAEVEREILGKKLYS